MSKVMVLDMKNETGSGPVSRRLGQKTGTYLKTFPPSRRTHLVNASSPYLP